jgi:hypothetical protein
MDREQKRQRTTEEEGAVGPSPGVNITVSAQDGAGTIHVLTENLGEEHTVGDVKTALSRQTEMSAETQRLYVVGDKRDSIEHTETGGELEDDELLGAVIHYNPICHSTKRLELLVTNFELEDWQILVKLRDSTGYASWTCKKEGWDTLEEHKDPSGCSGIAVDASGKIARIDLCRNKLRGKKSICWTSPVMSGVNLPMFTGPIPDSIGQLHSLKEMLLSSNNLSGLLTNISSDVPF